MPLDSLSFTAPARLRALLCPLGRIKRSRFSSFSARLQKSNVVRLGDVTPDPKRTMFSPQGFPDGQIVYDLATSLDREHENLEGFELHRRTFAVIAIADYQESNDHASLHTQYEELKFLYPNALYHVCLIFDAPPDGVPPNKTPHSEYPCFIAVPAEKDSKVTSIRTVMCDITSPVLSELCTFAKSLQTLPSLESPYSTENRPGSSKEHRMSMPTSGATLGAPAQTSVANKRTTMTGFGSGSVTERTRNKGRGRIQIAVAQLHLMAGRVPSALKEFVDGAEVCKLNNDHLWHGKALEGVGVCLVILAHLKVNFQIPQIPHPALELSKGTSPKGSKPGTPVPTAAIPDATPRLVLDILPELHESVVNLYNRASNFPGESVPHIVYSETIMRHAKALTSMYLSNGSADDAVAHMVLCTPIPPVSVMKNEPSRLDISLSVMRAYPQPIEAMTVLEATKVISGIASVLGTIGMARRKALITRELLKILIPGLIQARVVGAAEVGVHPAAGLSALTGAGGGPGGSPLDLAEGDVEHGIMDLLNNLCRSYGILPRMEFAEDEDNAKRMSTGTAMLKTAAVTKAVLAEQESRAFGWPALKIHVLRNCTALCEALPDFQGVLEFTTHLLRMADVELTKEEQIRLSTTVSRTVGAARKLGLPNVEADYWDQFLLRDVELVENSTWRPPAPHSRDELDDVDSDNHRPSAPIASKTPFIYNPSKKKEKLEAEQLLVKGEIAEFRITLQNPFEFEVEVESVTLDATGVDLSVQPSSVNIAPYRTFQVSVFATPNNTGQIHISGCKVRVYGCKERSFPIFTEGLDPRERDTKLKRYGLKAAEPQTDRRISAVSASGRTSRLPPVLHPIPKFLSLTVINHQPLLVVKNTSLSQSAIMILEGEKKVFDITLQNLTPVDVDLLVFSFTDSTTARIQQALNDKQSSPAEMYELDMMLAKKQAFVWRRPKESKNQTTYVPANDTATFQIEVLGKPGLTHGTIQADYSHLGCPRSEVTDRFFTRQVVFPITVTVNASIEVARVDFIPFAPDLSSHATTAATFPPLQQLFANPTLRSHPSDYCLMHLDLRNAWPHPLRISLTISTTIPPYTATDTIQAGHTTRIILPVHRIHLENPTLPIPSLSRDSRQFVVSTHKISLETERQSREAFWYREALLSAISGTWAELESSSSGDIELRGIRLSPRMVETVRVEDVGIAISIHGPDSAVRRISPAAPGYLVATDEFLTLTITITNRTTRRLKPILRILPTVRNLPLAAGLELNRRFAVNGLLQQVLEPLEVGEVRNVETGFVVLQRGEYEISAGVEEVLRRGVVGEAVEGLDSMGRPLDVLNGVAGAGAAGQGGVRRNWVCREVARVVARDQVMEAMPEPEVDTETKHDGADVPPVKVGGGVVPEVLVGGEAMPEIHAEVEAVPEVHVESEAMPEIHVDDETMPEVHAESEAVPEAQVYDETTPKIDVEGEAVPEAPQVDGETMSEVHIGRDSVPEVQVDDAPVPEIHVESETMSEVQVDDATTPEIHVENETIPEVHVEPETEADESETELVEGNQEVTAEDRLRADIESTVVERLATPELTAVGDGLDDSADEAGEPMKEHSEGEEEKKDEKEESEVEEKKDEKEESEVEEKTKDEKEEIDPAVESPEIK